MIGSLRYCWFSGESCQIDGPKEYLGHGVGGTVQQLRALVSLPGVLGSIPSIHMNCSPRGTEVFVSLLWAQACTWCRHARRQNSYAHNIFKNLKRNAQDTSEAHH